MRIESEVWTSLSEYDAKLKTFAEEASSAEKVYEKRLEEYAGKLFAEQKSLEDLSAEHVGALESQYEKLSDEISAYKIQMYSEIDERTRRGLSLLEEGVIEKLAELSKKEAASRELLEAESRSYTLLLEEVYAKTLTEQDNFEAKIQSSLKEAHESLNLAREAGAEESEKVLCEYKKLHEKAHELEIQLENRNEQLKESLEETLSLCVSKLSGRYAQAENAAEELARSFGESLKEQTEAAREEIQSGRNALEEIRGKIEALKAEGVADYSELRSRYEEIELSLKEVKESQEVRLKALAEEAGAAAREELAVAAEELYALYEKTSAEAAKRYGESVRESETLKQIIENIQEESESLKKRSELSFNDFVLQTENEIKQLKSKLAEEHEALSEMSRADYEKLCRAHEESLREARAETNAKLKELSVKASEELRESLREAAAASEEIRALKAKYAADLAEQKTAHEDYSENLKALNEAHEKETAKLSKDLALFENKLSELNLNYSMNLEVCTMSARREIERALNAGCERLSDGISEARAELNSLLQKNNADYESIRSLYDALENELRKMFEAGEYERKEQALARLGELRNELARQAEANESKLAEVEKYYTEELSKQFARRSSELDALEMRLAELGSELTAKDAKFALSYEELNGELTTYRTELNDLKASLENLGSQVGPEVLDRIRESENALSDRLEAMGAECDVFLREIENNFSEKRSEELREYSENIEQLKEEMRLASEQLKVRVGDEIRAAKEAVSVELSAEAAKQLAEYESKLSGRYEELTESFQKELSIYRETLNKLSVSSEERIAEVSAKYDESTAAEYRKYAVKLKEYSHQLTAVEEELERLKAEAESSLREQKRAVSGYAEEAALKYEALSSDLSGEFNRLSVEIRREAQSLTSGALKQNELLEELSADYGKLSGELEKCSENLARYRESMREAGAELRAEYGKLFAEQSEAAQARLNAINEEISAKVEAGVKDAVVELNEKIAEQAAERLNEITELVQQRINEIQSAEHTCEKELKIRIDSYTEEMNKMQLHCSELEMQYENAVRDGLRRADNLIEEKLTSMRDYIAKEKSIIGTVAIEQINTNGMKLDDLVNKAKEYQSAYEDLAVKMEQLESDVTGKVNVYLEQFAARMNEPVADAKRELADILTKVESLKDVIESKTRLMADEILKELDDKTEQIAGAAQLHSVEAEAKINELFAQVENHLENCRTTVQTQTEKLQKLEAAYQAQLSRKLGETDEAVEKELNNLHKAFLTASEKLSKETANLHREYEERERDLFASAQDSIEEMENKIVGLDSRIEAVGNEIGGKLEKQFAAAQEKMSNFTERQEKLYQTKIAELQKQFKAELESTQFTCNSKLAEMQTDIDNRTQDVYMKLNKIYDNFSVDAMKFDNENRERYRALLEKMEAAAEKVDTLKEELSMGMEERVKREFEMADELFVGKTQEMKENILRMEAENEKQLNDYRSELVRVQDALKVIEDDYSQMMKNKLAVLDEQAAHQLADIKSALSESVAVINFKMSELSDKMKSVENSYAEKAEFMLFNQEQKWKEIEDKYSNFDEHVNSVYRRLPNAAKEMDEVIAIGKAKLEDTVYSQIAQQKQHFQEVEMQLDAKALQLNKKMQEMQRSIRDVDSRFAAQYLERSGVLDERIASIEFEISKFERNIMLVQKTGEMKDELEKEICILKDTVAEVKADKNKMEVLGERMAELERTANERYEKLFAESQSYEDLNARIKDLQQEIESAEDKTQDLRDMRLATQQLDAKFIALERQFGRLDSMIGKIETSEAIAKDYSQKLNEMRSNVFELRQMMNTLESQWQEMEVKRKVYGEKMEHFESEADLILNSQSQINAVMTKFKQMDLLVEDLESRTGAVRHLQDWLIRAETRMENMKNDLQRVLPDEKIDVAESSGNLGESIRQLHRQGMSVEDIAKIVGTSREEVEFALELEDVLTSKR